MAKKYEKLKLIGNGTFGQVWLVRRRNSEKNYVLKELRLTAMSYYQKRQAVNEVTILSKCRHANIIRYKDAIIEYEHGLLGIVMEYAEHGDLYTRIQKQAGCYFTEDMICFWFVQICLALRYIHSHSILHRDLKTQNIFLALNDRIKVGDFGIARILENQDDLATTAIGTPYYLSPEICQRKPYNHKSDIWSFGCVLYELCMLEHPFRGNNFNHLVFSILKGQYRPIPRHYSNLLHDLLNVMLEVEPQKRPSAEEIISIPALQPHLRRYVSSENHQQMLDSSGLPETSSNDHWKHLIEEKTPKIGIQRRASVSTTRVMEESRLSQEKTKRRSIACCKEMGIDSTIASSPSLELCQKHTVRPKKDVNVVKPREWSRLTYLIKNQEKEASELLPERNRCPHSIRCQECVLETLWNNRLRMDDTKCAENLRETLDKVFGRSEVDRLKRNLIREWRRDKAPLQILLQSVRPDLVHYVPLLIQLVQLESLGSNTSHTV